MDPSRAKAEKEERERLERAEREAAEAAVRARILADENRKRGFHLVQSGNIISKYDRLLAKALEDQAVGQEWDGFLAFRPIPDLRKLYLVNSFLTEWTRELERGQTHLQLLFQHTPNILELLEEIRDYLQFPPINAKVDELNEMGLIYHEFQIRQRAFINRSSYNILMDLDGLYDPELGIIDTTVGIPEITHALWSNFYSRPELIGHYYEDLLLRFKIPEVLILTRGVYRLLKLEYDPYSDSSASFFPPRVRNFYQASIQNWICEKCSSVWEPSEPPPPPVGGPAEVQEGPGERRRTAGLVTTGSALPLPEPGPITPDQPCQKSVEKSRSRSRTQSESTKEGSAEPLRGSGPEEPGPGTEQQEADPEEANKDAEGPVTEEGPAAGAETGPPPRQEPKRQGKKGKGNGKEERTKTEAELAKDRERLEKAFFHPLKVHPQELNLRNYVILGGIYDFKLLEIPSQPRKGQGNSWTLHQIEDERCLKEIPFLADYAAPASSELHEIKRTPEEMEREAKRQEEELQKLVLLEMKVPKIALWFEPPTPVRWENDLRVWSTAGFHDVRFNEDSLQLSFRTTMFGTIGLGHNRWSNLPYQSWELRPNGLNGAKLSLMAAMAVLEFTFLNDLVCVSSLQNVSNSDVIEAVIVDKYMRPGKLIQALRYHGLDLFPEFDSYAYVDGVLVKHPEAEDHLYQCMAIGASTFNFHWSRWNLLAGRNKMVYQIRERHGTTTPGNYQMVLNTPRSAALINCTEVSPNYSEEPAGEYEYHADLLHLIHSVATEEAKDKMDQASGSFVETLRLLLSSIKCLSFS